MIMINDVNIVKKHVKANRINNRGMINSNIGEIVMITNSENRVVECKAKGDDWNLGSGTDTQHLFVPKISAVRFKCDDKNCDLSDEGSTPTNNWNKHVEDGKFTLNIIKKLDKV